MFNWLCFLCTAVLSCFVMTIKLFYIKGYAGMMFYFAWPSVVVLLLIIIITNYCSPNWWSTLELLVVNSILFVNLLCID